MEAAEHFKSHQARNTPPSAPVVELDDLRQDLSFSGLAIEEREAALAALDIPETTVVRRTTLSPAARYNGKAWIFDESVRFADGAVRRATIIEPDNPVSEAWCVGADPWVTGDKGINRSEILQMAEAGLRVAWLHHQGRHRIFPPNKERLFTLATLATSKSIAKAGAQELALVRDLQLPSDGERPQVLRRGYSRSGMSANAFEVEAHQENYDVVFSHHEAECFPHAIGFLALARSFVGQLPGEGKTISAVANELLTKIGVGQDTEYDEASLVEYLKTFDVHPLNVINELLWIKEFMSGEAGDYAKAVPLDARGIRIYYSDDKWSHIAKWLNINACRPGIVTLEMPGAHTAGARRRMRVMKGRTFKMIADYARQHDGNFADMTALQVLHPDYHKYIVQPTA